MLRPPFVTNAPTSMVPPLSTVTERVAPCKLTCPALDRLPVLLIVVLPEATMSPLISKSPAVPLLLSKSSAAPVK